MGLLWKTGRDVEMNRAVTLSGDGIAAARSIKTDFQVARGLSGILRQMLPAANLGGHQPQEALTAAGAGQLKVVRYAILPQVVPQYIAYTLYILDRNVRMATVIGLVGAGASARS